MSILADNTGAGAASGLILLLIGFGLGAYFLPTIIALVRKKANVVPIGALNFFLGWTLLGWVVSLVWALTKDQQQTIIVQNFGRAGASGDDSPTRLP
jgi:hypothetical protein